MNKKLGYYSVGNNNFESKIKACIYGNDKSDPVVWHFNEDVFENYSWHNEPVESLDTLYDKRAKQLREKYDYLIVSYSGGADSHNLLEAFLRQNLFIDEILVNTMTEGNSKYLPISIDNKSSHNAAASEHALQTIPRLKEIAARSPNTKINVIDLTQFLFTFFKGYGDASWIETKREGLNPLNATRYNYLYFSDIRKKFDKDKKIALVLGVEKPRTFIHKNKKDFYVRFVDRAANVASVADWIHEYPNSTVEYFYWSPEAVDIVCKQAHTIKKWLEINPQYQSLWDASAVTKDVVRLVHERILRTVIYTTWKDEWYQADKSTRDWYSEFDSWFISGHQGSFEHSVWLEGLKYVSKHASKYVYTDKGYSDGLKVFSYNFKIGSINTKL